MVRSTDKLNTQEEIDRLKTLVVFKEDGLYRLDLNEKITPRINQGGYVSVWVGGRYYMEHRIKWSFYNGPIPDGIDHIDRDRTNNDLSNLRLCKQGLNVANAGMRSDNTTGYMGVIWHKASNTWQAQTMFNGKRVHIGLFHCKREAALAYNYKLTELFGYQCTFNQVFEDMPQDVLDKEV